MSRLPAGSVDCHAHVLRADVPSSVSGARYRESDAPVASYLSVLDELGLDRGVLVTPSTYGTDNEVLVDALRTAPDRLRGVAVVPPDCSTELLAALHEAGVRGCRVQDRFPGGVDLHTLPQLAERIADLGWHLEVWTDLREHLDWLPAAIAASPVPVLLDHLAFLPIDVGVGERSMRELLAMARDGAVWVALSGGYRLAPGQTEAGAAQLLLPRVAAICECAPHSVVWGSDWPYVAPPGPVPTIGDLRRVLELWLSDEQVQRQVLVENPARLYDFPPQRVGCPAVQRVLPSKWASAMMFAC